MRDDRVVQGDSPAAVAGGGLLLEKDRLVGEGSASAAVLLWNREAEQADFAGAGPQVAVDLFLGGPALLVRGQFLLAERPRHGAEVVQVGVHPR